MQPLPNPAPDEAEPGRSPAPRAHGPLAEVGRLEVALARALFPLEVTAGLVWSVAELMRVASRPGDLFDDPHRERLIDDIERRGFYPCGGDELILRAHRGGWISAPSPYRRLGEPRRDRVVAHLSRSPRPTKRLLLVCHCYGVPSPRLMAGLFGASAVHADVATFVACHHERGGFELWPGAGFISARASSFIENVRASALGLRALTRTLVKVRGYEQVAVIGFSLGGQLALHLANAYPVDGALLYCPAINVRAIAVELGLMRAFGGGLLRALDARGLTHRFQDLARAEPLSYPLSIPQRRLHVVVQRHDLMASVKGIEPIRARYPESSWLELPGSHLVPCGRRALRAKVRALFD